MPFEIPHELIAEIQAITRKEANLPSYDPNSAVADLPSVEDAVSRLDPSPNYLRCKHCKGRLLNGVSSIVCVFCGTHPDTRPDSVRFTSTLAYRWFLSSLRLDGSEVVEVPSGEEEAKAGRRGQEMPAGKEMKLSELLDLEVRWTAPEAEKTAYDWRFGGSKLGGVDLSLLESSKREEEEEVKKAEQKKAEQVKKAEEEVKDGWQADFQFAGASAAQESHMQEGSEGKGFTSFDAFLISSTGNDLSEQLDSVFGSDLKSKDGGVASTSASYANESWFDDGDLWSGGGGVAGVSSAVAGISSLSEEHGAISHGISSSLDVDLFREGQWQSNATSKDTSVKAIGEDEDAFDDWDDFTGSGSANKSGNDDVVGGIDGAVSSHEQQASGMDLFYEASSNPPDVDFGAFSQSDFFSRGLDTQHLATGLDAIQPETSASAGIKGTSDAVEWNLEDANVDNASNGTTKSKDDDVETIMSQMHDLSFMLATELSIPQKKDPFGSVSTD